MTLFGINEKFIRKKVSKVVSVCGCEHVTGDITECGQLKLQSLSQTGGWEGLGGSGLEAIPLLQQALWWRLNNLR